MTNPHKILAGLKRVQLHELYSLELHTLWVDHVLYDIPNTVIGAIENAPLYVKAVTIHMEIAGHRKYERVPEVCKERGIILTVALPPKFDRVLYEDWINLEKYHV